MSHLSLQVEKHAKNSVGRVKGRHDLETVQYSKIFQALWNAILWVVSGGGHRHRSEVTFYTIHKQ